MKRLKSSRREGRRVSLLPAIPEIGPETRFVAWVVGLIELIAGLTMLLLPFLFESAIYDNLRSKLLPAGLVITAVGLALLIWQFLPLERTRVPQISLICGGLAAFAWAVGSSLTHSWPAACLSVAVTMTALPAAFGAERRLPPPAGAGLFGLGLAGGMASMGIILLSNSALSAPTYELMAPYGRSWGAVILLAALLLLLWLRLPTSRVARAFPVLAGLLIWLWCYEYAVRNELTLAVVSGSLVGLAAILRPFLPQRLLVPPPSRLVNSLVAVSTLLVGVALALLMVMLLNQTEAAYEERARRDLSTTAALTGTESAALLQNQVRLAQLMVRDADFLSPEPSRQTAAMQRAMALDPAASQISVTNRDGVTVLRSTGAQPGVDPLQNQAGLSKLLETHQRNWELTQSPTLGVPVLAIREPVLGPAGELEGAFIIQVSLTTIGSQLQALLSSLGGRIIIVDDQGRAVVHPDRSYVANRTDLSSLAPIYAARSGHTGPFIYREGGRRWLAAPVVVQGLGWTVDAERPQLLVLAPSIHSRLQSTAFLAVVLLFSGAIAFAFARGFIRPVVKLVQAARALGEGAMDTDLPPPGHDEVGELVRAFREMRDRLVARTAERERAVQSAARSRQEVELLLDASDRLNAAIDADDVLKSVVAIAAVTLGAARADVATSQNGLLIERYSWAGRVWDSRRILPSGDGSVAGWVVGHLRPYRGEPPIKRPDGTSPAEPQAVLAVPILARDGNPLACLSVYDRSDGELLSDEDLRLAEGIAHHASVALERTALVEELRQSEERFRHQALSDALTGLPNRAFFMERLTRELDAAKREQRDIAVLFLDLDGFKTINDSLGHAVGDEILVAVGQRLEASRDGSVGVARFGGDEFAILLEDVPAPSEALQTADRLLAELRKPIEAGSRELAVTASFGIALGGQAHADVGPDDLLRQADIALYQAKAAGKAQAVLFDPQMSAQAVERWALENDLRQALARDEFRLYYQPIFELRSGRIIGTEALLRWEHPHRGLLQPEVFVPLAEETGLIIPIGAWVLDQACLQAHAWWSRRRGDSPLIMSVNLSARQLQQPDLVDLVAAVVRDRGVEPGQLELELTESVIMLDREGSIPRLEALKRLGVRVVIDDFGTGYSSLSYLQRLPLDGLKIDRSFIAALDGDAGSGRIVQVVIDLAHAGGLTVTAEGVETLDQLEQLRGLGCDRAQGYYLASPAPRHSVESLIPAEPA